MGESADSHLRQLGNNALATLLVECFGRSELERVTKKAGLQFPGYRLGAIDTLELAFALAEGVIAREPGSEVVEREVHRVLDPLAREVAGRQPNEIRSMVEGPWAFGSEYRPGALRVVLATDPRPSVQKLVQRVSKRAASDAPPGIKASRAPGWARALAGALARRAEELERRTEELKRELASCEEKLALASREAEALGARVDGAEAEAARARAEAQGARSAEREARALRHEAAELRRELEALRPRAAEREEALRTCGVREQEIARLREDLAQARRERDRAIEASSSHGSATPAPRPCDPTRAGLVVDAQSLYFPARERGARVDFGALKGAIPKGLLLGRAVVCVGEILEVDTGPFRERLRALGYEVRPMPAPPRDQGRRGPDERARRVLEGTIRDTAYRYGTVVVATQCAELAGALVEARATGARVRLMAFAAQLAPQLREAADEIVDLAEGFLFPLGARTRA